MLDLVPSTRINSDASEDDLKNGEYRDALNITLMAFEAGAWSKGTTYGNIDTNIVFQGLQPDAICLGTAIDTAGRRVIIIFYQTIPVVQEVLMYLIPEKVAGILSPLVKSSLMQLTPESYLDGYSFVNELFYFNFRESAPKMINIDRALDSPGFYDNIAETSLTVIKPHPPLPPIVSRSTVVIAGQTANLSMMKKPFQFMTIYRFMDGEESTKSPASVYLNSLDDKEITGADYGSIKIDTEIPLKDYSIVKDVELYVRNTNDIADWRSVTLLPRELFLQVGGKYTLTYYFYDNVVGNFLAAEQGIKINDAIPQRSNYLAFIENRIFLIDSLIDYDFSKTFQILVTLDDNSANKLPDDRSPANFTIYSQAEFEYDSEYTVGIAVYDKYGRKYPTTKSDVRLVTPAYIPAYLPTNDALPKFDGAETFHIKKAKITAKYDLRSASNIANYGKPPSYAFWWGLVRGKNTKWEFQHAIQGLLRFPYSITKWTDTDPANFPFAPAKLVFLEDEYLYWDPAELLNLGAADTTTRAMVNDYIDVVIPPNFPYTLDNSVLIDFMIDVIGKGNTRLQITNREVVAIFANKIRIRGNRNARWFSNDPTTAPFLYGHYRRFPKFTTGVNLTGTGVGQYLYRNETTFPIVVKRKVQNNLSNIILYDTPEVFAVTNPGTKLCSFQPGQTATILRVEYKPIPAPPTPPAETLAKTLDQGNILIQPILITPTTAAYNHKILVKWGPNSGDSLGLRVKVSIWQLNDQNQPIVELYSATEDANGAYYVKNSETVEYLINVEAELITGWFGYGVQILTSESSITQFDNYEFDEIPAMKGWQQSNLFGYPLRWRKGSTDETNFTYIDIATLGGGFSEVLFQFLNKVTKADIIIQVEIDAINMIGPPSSGSSALFPGNAGSALVDNVNQSLSNLGVNVTPFFLDCPPGLNRVLTFNTLQFELVSTPTINTQVRAEIWRVDQVTRQPISVVAGSEGAWLPVTTAGTKLLSFGATNIIDITGWYGVAIRLSGPSIADFQNKNYSSGAASWIVKAGSPTWAFLADQAVPPVYVNVEAGPTVGADLGYLPILTGAYVNTPVFFPASVEPTGYNQFFIKINWGDNSENGWIGGNVRVAIWDVDQVTKKPTSYAPIASADTVVPASSGVSTHFVSGSVNLLGNKWYSFGVSPVTHPSPAANQFTNSKFASGVAGWTISSGSGTSWIGGSSGVYTFARYTISTPGSFGTGPIGQNLAGYCQIMVPVFAGIASNYSALSANLVINGVTKQTINILSSLPASSTKPLILVFDPFFANGQRVDISFSGITITASLNIDIYGVANVFSPYLLATPKIKFYDVSGADHESWRNFGAGVVDPFWLGGYSFWAESQVGATTSSFQMYLRPPAISGSASYISLYSSTPPSVGFTSLMYGSLNMQEQLTPVSFRHVVELNASIGSGSYKYEVWAFNDIATFEVTGVKIADLTISSPSGAKTFDYIFNMPPGFRFIGHRKKITSSVTDLTSITRSEFIPQAVYTYAWSKMNRVMSITSVMQDTLGPATTRLAHFTTTLPAGAVSVGLGQDNLVGLVVRANIELFAGLPANDYDLILTDSSGAELGRTNVLAQGLSVNPSPVINPQITVTVSSVPTTTGLFLKVENKNASGPNLSVRIRQITNENTTLNIAADATSPANTRTWKRDFSNNNTLLTSAAVVEVDAGDTVSTVPVPITVVLADAAGTEISVPQTFVPNMDGTPDVLLFTPTLQADGNYNFGVKVKNNPANNQFAGTIRIHSIQNVYSNESNANILASPIDALNPLYEAWNQFSFGAFVLAGYVSNFIAVGTDITMSAFTPQQIPNTSYHLVHDIVPAPIEGHSTLYGDTNADNQYMYGFVYPFAGSDPDAMGIAYTAKVGHSIGDVNIKDLDQRQRSNSNIVRWSDPIIVGTQVNNLNAFTDGNKYTVDFQRGAIQVMSAMHDHTLFCVHVQGMSSLYVQRSIMSSPAIEGEDQIFLTTNVVGTDNKLYSNLGTVNPESVKVVESGTLAYGFDLLRKSFWQKSNNGVRNLTYECHAKNFFDNVCYYRLKAHTEGEDIKIYTGYNEKQKSYYLTFAPFIYRGQLYPAVTVAYNSYIDGFLSRYSFEPISYLATEDIVHTVKAREMNNPDFFGNFNLWKTTPGTGGFANWFKSTTPGNAEADTTTPASTRILNPDFEQVFTFWTMYGAGTPWVYLNEGMEATLAAGGESQHLVNTAGAVATYIVRISLNMPIADIRYSVNIYDAGGAVQQAIVTDAIPTSGETFLQVTQNAAGRIGIIIKNVGIAPLLVHLNLFTTVVKSYVLYQPMPVAAEGLRVRLVIPERLGSIVARVYAFDEVAAPEMSLLQEVNLIHNKDSYSLMINVDNPSSAKFIGVVTLTDYDKTMLSYFNVNSVPSVWAHDQAGRANNFYGVQYDSAIELVFNVKAGQVRIFNSLGIMSETAWSVESIVTSEGQISALDTANFRLRDGIYSAAIMRDVLTPQESLPDPVKNRPITHGSKLTGVWTRMTLRNSETLRQVELRAVYLGSDELAGNLLGKM